MVKVKVFYGYIIIFLVVQMRGIFIEYEGSRGGIWGLRRVEKFYSSCYGEFDRVS